MRAAIYPPLPLATWAEVAKLADALDLGSSAFGRRGSSPLFRTKQIAGSDLI